MTKNKSLSTSTPNIPQKGRKSTRKVKPKKKLLSDSYYEDQANLTASSIEPLHDTFIFQPNQQEYDQESPLEFIATEKSFIAEELTQDIELEIYKASIKDPPTKNPQIHPQKSIPQKDKTTESIKTTKPIKQYKNTRNFQKSLEFQNNIKINASIKLNTSIDQVKKNITPKKLNSKPKSITPQKKSLKPVNSESKRDISPKRVKNIEPKLNPKKVTKVVGSNSAPSKKLKSDKCEKNQPLVKFTVEIKLLNGKENVKKVVKLANSEEIKKLSEALYVVEIEGGQEQKVMNSVEMTNLYKDALIDFYQGIHFD